MAIKIILKMIHFNIIIKSLRHFRWGPQVREGSVFYQTPTLGTKRSRRELINRSRDFLLNKPCIARSLQCKLTVSVSVTV